MAAEREIVRDVKKKLRYVAVDFDSVMKSASESFDKEKTDRFRCPQVLPHQALWGEASGIHDTTFQSIMKCDVVIRKGLPARVVLPEDTTMIAGIGERMAKELTALTLYMDWWINPFLFELFPADAHVQE